MNPHRTLRASAPALALSIALCASLASSVASAQQPSPPDDRSMAFRPGLGDAARERIPGGRLVISAYSAVLLILGAYVAFVARKATRLEGELRRLEDDLARRSSGSEKA